jgi:hypothetical protein
MSLQTYRGSHCSFGSSSSTFIMPCFICLFGSHIPQPVISLTVCHYFGNDKLFDGIVFASRLRPHPVVDTATKRRQYPRTWTARGTNRHCVDLVKCQATDSSPDPLLDPSSWCTLLVYLPSCRLSSSSGNLGLKFENHRTWMEGWSKISCDHH